MAGAPPYLQGTDGLGQLFLGLEDQPHLVRRQPGLVEDDDPAVFPIYGAKVLVVHIPVR